MGRISAVKLALYIISAYGVDIQYTIQPAKSKAYWPTMNLVKLRVLTDVYPLALQNDVGGIVFMGAPLVTPKFCADVLLVKLPAMQNSLQLLEGTPNARLAYQVQRMTASAGRFTHRLRIMPPSVLYDVAAKFDAEQALTFAAICDVALNDRSRN